ncbi:MAG TPA: PHB depolymerase family esterase [Burkholderiaceae bacterium]|nr:PHB depolymerase family esterase [Burkholderiaceae bacterium]
MSSLKLASIWKRAAKQQVRTLARAGEKAARQLVKAALAADAPPPGHGDWLQGAALGPAGMRRWRLFRPAVIRSRRPLPMLVMLHGCGQDAHVFALSTGMNRVAGRHGFLVLYPEQDRRVNPQGCWNWFDTRTGRALAEVATLAVAIEQAVMLYGADRERIAIAGLSAGASMAALLGVRRPHLFCAVAMHSGVPPGMACSSGTAARAMMGFGQGRPLMMEPAMTVEAPLPPLLVLHGREDPLVSVRNATAAAEMWAQAAGAQAGRERVLQRGQRHPMHVIDYKRGRRMVATLCEVQGLGHAWSGGDGRQNFSDPKGPDASSLVWRFVRSQFDGA